MRLVYNLKQTRKLCKDEYIYRDQGGLVCTSVRGTLGALTEFLHSQGSGGIFFLSFLVTVISIVQ